MPDLRKTSGAKTPYIAHDTSTQLHAALVHWCIGALAANAHWQTAPAKQALLVSAASTKVMSTPSEQSRTASRRLGRQTLVDLFTNHIKVMGTLLKRFWTEHRLATVISLALLFLGLLIKPWTLVLVLVVAFGGPVVGRLERLATSPVSNWSRSLWIGLALLLAAVLLALTGSSGGQGALILALLPVAWVLVTDRSVLQGSKEDERASLREPLTLSRAADEDESIPEAESGSEREAADAELPERLIGGELLAKIKVLGDVGESDKGIGSTNGGAEVETSEAETDDLWIEKSYSNNEFKGWPSDAEALKWMDLFTNDDCWQRGLVDESDPKLVLLSLGKVWDDLPALIEAGTEPGDGYIEGFYITAQASRCSFSEFQEIYEGDYFDDEWKRLGTDDVSVCNYFERECEIQFRIEINNPESKNIVNSLLALNGDNAVCFGYDYGLDIDIIDEGDIIECTPLVYVILLKDGSEIYMPPAEILSKSDSSCLYSLFSTLNSTWLSDSQLETMFRQVYGESQSHAEAGTYSKDLSFLEGREKLISLLLQRELCSDRDELQEGDINDCTLIEKALSVPLIKNAFSANGIVYKTMIHEITRVAIM